MCRVVVCRLVHARIRNALRNAIQWNNVNAFVRLRFYSKKRVAIQLFAALKRRIKCMILAVVHAIVQPRLCHLVVVDLANHLIKTRVNVNVRMAMSVRVRLSEIWRLVLANALLIRRRHLIVAQWAKY
jgi:hypothetical protein